MATNADQQTHKITLSKKTVKVTNAHDETDYVKALKRDGKYILPWKSTLQPPDSLTNFRSFFTISQSNVPWSEAKLDEEPLMQMMAADPSRIENPPENGIRVTWLGHSSALFQLDNVNILVNPNFDQRGVKYYYPLADKRYRKPVYTVDQLPRIDCVFITNTHFDYLDKSSVISLNDRFGEMLLWYVPMGVADWMSKCGCVNVVELDWWKEDEVDFIDHTKLNEEDEDTSTTTFNISCTPSQSYHSRSLNDDNAVLWCSWVIVSPRYKLFVSGATGYNDKIFKAIGRRYGPFHMAAIPIGGYLPSWQNGYGNVNPEESVQIHQDVLAMCSLALSWGTFTVSDEYFLEPPQRLNDELRKQGLSEMQFFLLKHGESRLIEIKEADKDDVHDHGAPNGHAHGHENGNGHVHVDVDIADLINGDVAKECEEGDKGEGDVTVEVGGTTGTVEITTETETVVTEEDGETVTVTAHTEHSEVHTDVVTDVIVDGDGDVVTTTTETITIEGHDHDSEHHHDDHEQHHLEEEDASVLQQLVDQFVDETQ